MNADQIESRYNDRIGRVLGGFEGAKRGIRSNTGLTDIEREDRILEAHERYAGEYEEAVAERNARYAEREAEINSGLYGAPAGSASGAAFTNSLLQARAADDKELSELADLAARTGDENLGRAVLAVAAQRGDIGHAVPYIDSNEEILGLFRELLSIPNAEERESAERSGLPMPNLDSLRPSAQTRMDAARAQAADRVRRAMRSNP